MSYAGTKKDAAFYEALGPEHPVNRDRPTLNEDEEYWFDAFAALSMSRPIHMDGPGSVPLSEMEAYCRLTGVTQPDDREDFMRIMRRLDADYLDLLEQRKNGASKLIV